MVGHRWQVGERSARRFVLAAVVGLMPGVSAAADGTVARVVPELRSALSGPVSRRMVTVDRVAMSIYDSDPTGMLPAIVCLHAIGHGGRDFDAFEAAFRDRYRIVSIDWPGHGASSDDHAPASAERYAQLVLGVLDALGLDAPVLFGNSIGGAAAISLAEVHPERVRALVLCNPGGLDPGGPLARMFIHGLVARFERGQQGDPGYLDWYARYYDRVLLGEAAASRRSQIVATGYETAPRLVEAWTSFAAPEADLRGGLPSLNVPVFVGWAMRDRLVQWGRNRGALQRIPDLTLVPFTDSAHAPFLEQPDAFNGAVAPFLERLAARGGSPRR
jgi:pimeloyl-ACP methyl ester carboxylesterase